MEKIYRYPIDKTIRGALDNGNAKREARELEEEAGYQPGYCMKGMVLNTSAETKATIISL